MSAQYGEAIKRAFFGGVLTAGVTGLTVYQQAAPTDVYRIENAVIAALIALFTYVIARGGVEGWIDTGRAERGDVIPADVHR